MPSELLVDYGPTTRDCRPSREGSDYQAMRQMLRIVESVKTWALTVETRLLKAYLAPQLEGLRLFAIGRGPGDYSPLGDSLSDLSSTLADEDLDLRTMVLPDGPPDELAAFFDPGAALLLSWKEPCPVRSNTETSTPATACS